MRLQVKLCNMWDLHKFTEFRVTCDNRESRKSTIAEAMVGLKKLENMASDWGITAIVSADRRGIVIEWGDAHRPINVRSLRKSILTGLYGATSVEKPNVNDTAQNPTGRRHV